MNTQEGVVEKVINKNGFNYFTLEDIEGLFSTYKTVPACSIGDKIEFIYTQKGEYRNADASTIKVTQAGSQAAAPGNTGNSGYVPNNSRQISIELQSARRDAIQVIELMLVNGIIKLPKTQADKYDAVCAIIAHTTQELYSWVKDSDAFLASDIDSANSPEEEE